MSKQDNCFESDVLILGAGVAGLSLSLYLNSSYSITLLSKSDLYDSSSNKAQGGIACVTDLEDTYEEHISDTLSAGAGLCDKNIVDMVIKNAQYKIQDLKKWGVEFTGGNSSPELGREGGHSKRRILHKEDRTGEELVDKLYKKSLERENVKFLYEHTAINLIVHENRCYGAYVLDNSSGKVKTFLSKITVLATGGCGKVYLYTSNPGISTGDGVAMAYRAGARIANMEFIQFHPTNLYSSKIENFLITEAMRGEGAVLLSPDGQQFMDGYSPLKELAPRDVVARAIDDQMKKYGAKHVYLDIHSYRDPEFIKKRFPSIYKKLMSIGIDIIRENIPVVPAAHYCCGGIQVNKDGFTDIERLMALGECSHTGLHGANRLASNSLLEAIVFSSRAAESVNNTLPDLSIGKADLWEYTGTGFPRENIYVEHNWLELRRLMWNYVGVVRSDRRLNEAYKRLKLIKKEVEYHYWNYMLSRELIELRNIVQLAEIIILSSMKRKESRGLHYNIDYPEKDVAFADNTYIKYSK